MDFTRIVASLGAGLCLVGCAPQWNAAAQIDVKNRASYDLQCAPQDMRLIGWRGQNTLNMAMTWAAEGCGQRAVYIWNGSAWSLDYHAPVRKAPPPHLGG